jgi:hypothetical protein
MPNTTNIPAPQMVSSLFGELVHSYSRAQAIEDGVLVDVTEIAREAGFRIPVALTAAAWADCVAWSDSDRTRQTSQDEAGRLWNVVWMSHLAARRAAGRDGTVVELYCVPRGGRGSQPRKTQLRMVIGPDDDAAPVITIMCLGED